MILIPLVCAFIGVSVAQPTDKPNTLNVITVPANCPEGQELVNGACRDIWSWRNDPNAANLGVVAPSSWNRNVVTAPSNCPPGQQLINGVCRDIWRFVQPTTPLPKIIAESVALLSNRNIVTVPSNCPPGQQLINGVCRDVWSFFRPTTPLPKTIDESILDNRDRRQTDTEVNEMDGFKIFEDMDNRNIINVPNQCPIGYKPDSLGICRPILI